MISNLSNVIAIVEPVGGGHHDTYLRLITKYYLDQNLIVICFASNNSIVKEFENNKNLIFIKFKYEPKIRIKLFTKLIYPIFLWLKLENQLNKIRKRYSKVFVLITYIDTFLTPLLNTKLFNSIFKFDYSCIYFNPEYFRKRNWIVKKLRFDKLLSSKKCQSIGIINTQDAINRLSKRLNTNVCYFPEIISTDIIKSDYLINKRIKQIKDRARGRKIIAVLGDIHSRKNIINLLKIREKLSESIFIVIIGQFDDSSFSDEELNFIHKMMKDRTNNFILNSYIETEAKLNALYSAIDIVYCVYREWNLSSNALTKSAYFNKPVLVSYKGYIADVISKYNIGKCVDGDSLRSIEDGIVTIINNYSTFKKNTTVYYKDNDTTAMKNSLIKLLNI